MNKNIVVTGGLGFIGSNLIELLIQKKYFVINIDKMLCFKFLQHKKFKNSKITNSINLILVIKNKII